MSELTRGTKHNGRTKKHTNEPYNPKHNDRQYEDMSHLKRTSKDNIYCINGIGIMKHEEYLNYVDSRHKNGKPATFEEMEDYYYKMLFSEQYNQQMERHIKGGHKDRVKTFDEWKKDKRYCPEETILQIGNMENQIDNSTSKKILLEYLNWEQEWGRKHNCFYVLDFAIHTDETVIHAHSRRVWFSKNEDGIVEIGQEKALERAGIPLPDTTKHRSRGNNRKMTFDKLSREKFLEICEKYGVNMEHIPLPNSPHNLDKDEMIYQKFKRKEKAIADKEKAVTELHNALLNDLQTVKSILDAYTVENPENEQIKALEEYLSTLQLPDGSTALESFRRKQESKQQEIRRDTSRIDEIMERWYSHGNSDDFEMGK